MAEVPRLLAAHTYSAANWLALHARRHMHHYGTTKEQLGWWRSTVGGVPH
jgi:acetyl-CoA acetyltransferase